MRISLQVSLTLLLPFLLTGGCRRDIVKSDPVNKKSLPRKNLKQKAASKKKSNSDENKVVRPSINKAVSTEEKKSSEEEFSLILVCQGELSGYLRPCHCTDGMIGGLSRRAAFIEALKKKNTTPVLIMDFGDLVEDASLQSQFKYSTILESYEVFGCDSIGLGGRDLALGASFLIGQYINHESFSLISANMKIKAIQPILHPFRFIKISGLTVFITSIIDPDLVTGLPEVVCEDPVRVGRGLKSVAEKADLKVLLAPVELEKCREWAKEFGFFDVIIGGTLQEYPVKPEKIGKTTLVCPGSGGKYIVQLKLKRSEDGIWKGKFEKDALSEKVGEDETVLQFYRQYQRLLTEAGSQGFFSGDKKEHPKCRFIGSDSCSGCHKKAYKKFLTTRHASALNTLKKIGSDSDPDCLVCHTVGYRYKSGYSTVKKVPGLEGVGCESCHGPGKLHNEKGEADLIKRSGEKTCRSCHTELHSPNFDFEEYLDEIKH